MELKGLSYNQLMELYKEVRAEIRRRESEVPTKITETNYGKERERTIPSR